MRIEIEYTLGERDLGMWRKEVVLRTMSGLVLWVGRMGIGTVLALKFPYLRI